MENARIARIVERLAAAAQRIEAAAYQPARAADATLERNHAELKASVVKALDELDRLIGTLEQ